MKFSASVVALAAAVLAANAAPASDPPNKNLGGDNVNQNACGGDQVIRVSNNQAKQGGLLSGLGLTRRQNNKNLGGDGVNQNCGGDQVIRDSNNEATDDGLLGGLIGGLGLAKRNGGYYYVPTINHNKNLGGDGVNQNTGGDQVVRDSNNEAEQGGLIDGLGLDGLLSKRSGGYYYFPTVNQNDNLGGDATNQNSGGDQVVRDSNNDITDDSLLGGLGLGGLLTKRNAGYYYFPTVNDNQNNGGDGVNQNTGGDQVVRDSNSEAVDNGLLSGLLSKRGGYYYFPTVNDNQNNGGDAVNQNGGGDQVVRDSNNAAEQGGLLAGLGLAKRGYYYFPTVNNNKNLGGDRVNQNTGGDQVVRDSNNKAEQGGLLQGLGL